MIDPSTERNPIAPSQPAARALAWTTFGVLGVWSVHNGWLLPWELRNLPEPLQEPTLIALRALVWLVPIRLYLRRHEPRPAMVALGIASPLHLRGAVLSSLGAVAYLALIGFLLQASAVEDTAQASAATGLLRVEWLYALLKAGLEEVLLRGFVLGQLVRFVRSGVAQATVATLFALMHLPGWIAMQGLNVGLIPSTVVVLLLGGVLGVVARASNSILPAVAVHLANNLLADWLGGS